MVEEAESSISGASSGLKSIQIGFDYRCLSRRLLPAHVGPGTALLVIMMTILLSLVGASWLGGLAFVAHGVMTAPEGCQDEKGFHYIRKPIRRRKQRAAGYPVSSGAAWHRA
jgi:hypothetical protein